jgi:hypothetical protein
VAEIIPLNMGPAGHILSSLKEQAAAEHFEALRNQVDLEEVVLP